MQLDSFEVVVVLRNVGDHLLDRDVGSEGVISDVFEFDLGAIELRAGFVEGLPTFEIDSEGTSGEDAGRLVGAMAIEDGLGVRVGLAMSAF